MDSWVPRSTSDIQVPDGRMWPACLHHQQAEWSGMFFSIFIEKPVAFLHCLETTGPLIQGWGFQELVSWNFEFSLFHYKRSCPHPPAPAGGCRTLGYVESQGDLKVPSPASRSILAGRGGPARPLMDGRGGGHSTGKSPGRSPEFHHQGQAKASPPGLGLPTSKATAAEQGPPGPPALRPWGGRATCGWVTRAGDFLRRASVSPCVKWEEQ